MARNSINYLYIYKVLCVIHNHKSESQSTQTQWGHGKKREYMLQISHGDIKKMKLVIMAFNILYYFHTLQFTFQKQPNCE